jgi:hypothetical protein
LQVEIQAHAFPKSGVVEKVDYIAPEPILHAAALLEVEGTARINLHVTGIAQDGAQLALKR